MRYIIKLSYSGADFCGWQIQKGSPSVQETLQDCLSTLLKEEIQVTGAGRTDTGVNAVGYIAHFDSTNPLLDNLAGGFAYKLNAILPKSICVHSLAKASGDFHARFSARRREYTYFLHRCKDPFADRFSWLYGYRDLDFELMNKAAEMLVGTHDFSCFQKVGSDVKTPICSVTEAYWKPYAPTHIALMGNKESSTEDNYWYFRISADRFLRNMVRAVTGTLLEVGRGKRTMEDFSSLILPADGGISGDGIYGGGISGDGISGGGIWGGKPNRCAAGESVPGHALFLSGIDY